MITQHILTGNRVVALTLSLADLRPEEIERIFMTAMAVAASYGNTRILADDGDSGADESLADLSRALDDVWVEHGRLATKDIDILRKMMSEEPRNERRGGRPPSSRGWRRSYRAK